MEIGPRSGGNFVPQIIGYATGFDMVNAFLDILEGKTVNDFLVKRDYAAYFVIHSEFNGILTELSLNDEIHLFVKEFHQYIKIGEKVNAFHSANAAIGVILLTFYSQFEMDYYIQNMAKFINLEIKRYS